MRKKYLLLLIATFWLATCGLPPLGLAPAPLYAADFGLGFKVTSALNSTAIKDKKVPLTANFNVGFALFGQLGFTEHFAFVVEGGYVLGKSAQLLIPDAENSPTWAQCYWLGSDFAFLGKWRFFDERLFVMLGPIMQTISGNILQNTAVDGRQTEVEKTAKALKLSTVGCAMILEIGSAIPITTDGKLVIGLRSRFSLTPSQKAAKVYHHEPVALSLGYMLSLK